MKISKGYIKQVIREELEELSQEQLVENQLIEEGFKEFGAAVIASLALAAGAQAKPVTVTSETNGVQKTYVVDAPDDVSAQEIQMYLQKKANERQAAKPADQRSAPIFFSDVHDSTPDEVAKLPAFKKSDDGGVKVEKPGAAQKSDAGVKKAGAAQATEVSSTGNTSVYKVTGAKDRSDAIQAAMNAKMNAKGGSSATFNGNARADSDGAGGFTVTLTGNIKESKKSLEAVIKEEIEKLLNDNKINESFYGRRYGSRNYSQGGRSEYGHARPGELFNVPGRAKLYYWVMEGDQKVPYARTFSFNGRKGPSSDEIWNAFEAVQDKFGDKFAGLMKDRGEEGVEILSYPQEIEN